MAYTPSTPGVSNQPGVETPTGGGNFAAPAMSEAYQTQLDLFDPPDIVEHLYERHDHEAGFRFMLASLQKSRGWSQPHTAHYERGRRTDLIKLGTVETAAGGAGNNLVMNLHADAMYATTAYGQSSYPRVNQMILFPDGNKAMIIAKDTSVNPHRVTLRPTKAAVDLDSSVTANKGYALVDNAWGEGTGLPSTVQFRVWKYQSQFQIVKEALKYTGSAATNEIRFTTHTMPDGSKSPIAIINNDMLIRYEIQCDDTLLFGDEIDNITVASDVLGSNVAVKGTVGFDTFSKRYGHQYEYTIGSFDQEDFDAIGAIQEKERITSARKNTAIAGYAWTVEVSNAFDAYVTAGGNRAYTITALKDIYLSEMQEMDKDDDEIMSFAVNMGFNAIYRNGFSYSWKKFSKFSDATSVGAGDYDYTNRAIFTPYGFVKDLNAQGEKRKTRFIHLLHKQLGSFSRERVIGHINGVGSNTNVVGFNVLGFNSNQYDGSQVGIVSEIALHMASGNRIMYILPD